MKKFNIRALLIQEAVNELPFFIFLTLILSGIAALSIMDSPALRDPLRIAIFIMLMLAHIALYWLSAFWVKDLRRTLVYLVLQGLLAFTLNLLGRNLALIFGLYMGLIGISVGMLKLTRWGLVMIAFYLGLSVLSYSIVVGWDQNQFGGWMIAVGPMTIFVIIYVFLYNRQSEARARAQALLLELEAANRQLTDYAGRVEDLTLANERQRMARELHDTLSQGLAGLILQLEAADAHLAGERSERARAIVQLAMQQARATLADARRAIGDLRQPAPQPRDPAEAVRLEVERFTAATGIPCELSSNLPAPLPASLSDPLQRIVAEALTNVARHARAAHVQIELAVRDGALDTTISDDGVGFDPAAPQPQTAHYGLLGMRERARLAGGTLEITRRPAAGTLVRLILPLS